MTTMISTPTQTTLAESASVPTEAEMPRPELVQNSSSSGVPPAKRTNWIGEHWSPGVVGGLVLLEGFVLFICFLDLAHFLFTGLSVADAWALTTEEHSFEKWMAVAQGTGLFCVFFLIFPVANAGLLAGLRHLATKGGPGPQPESEKRPEGSTVSVVSLRFLAPLVRRGKTIWTLHLLFSVLIPLFTVLLGGMQLLDGNGYSSGSSLQPAFFSLWLTVVSAVKWVTPAFVLPVVRKYLVRMFGGEHPHIFHVLSEIFTEEGLKG
jgi:hypothetical protein